MWLRLRQVALAAHDLADAVAAIRDVLDLNVCYRDPAVGEFGLENALFPLGHQFLEVVAPTRPGTAAGRFLERRGGDGGYMVITQCDDHAARRRRVDALGVRIAHEFVIDNFRNMQLHPRDTGGSFFEIDQQLGTDADAVDGPWAPAGPDWREHVSTSRVRGVSAVEITVREPLDVAERWADIAELPIALNDGAAVLELDNAAVRFAPVDDAAVGLTGVDLLATDADAVLAAARVRGLAVSGRAFELLGIHWRLV